MTERRDPAPHNVIIRYWCDEYERHVGTKYPFNGGKDGSAIKWLRGLYTDDEIRAFMAAFFEMDDEFIANSGYALGVFRGCLPKVIAYVQRQKPKADMRGHYPPCKTNGECLAKIFADAKHAKTHAS